MITYNHFISDGFYVLYAIDTDASNANILGSIARRCTIPDSVQQNKVVGFIFYTLHKEGVYLARGVFIRPSYRRRGIATAIRNYRKEFFPGGVLISVAHTTQLGRAFVNSLKDL